MQELKKPLSIGFLFDDTLDSNDGVAQQVKRLGDWLSQHGHHVVYLCGETKMDSWAGGKVYSLSRNIKVKFNGNRLSMPLISHSKNIKQALKAEKLDVIHVQVPYSPLLAQRVINKAYKQSAIVGTFHILPSGAVADLGSRLLGVTQRLSLKKFDSMISVSSSAAVFAEKNFGIKSVVIPNMIDLSSFESAARPSSQQIVFLGRLVKRKGCTQLIRAFATLSQTHPAAKLVIAGGGPERQNLEKLVDKLGIRQKVSFKGFIAEKDKPDFLASAAIACFPSLYGESFGVVLIEAMAAGAGVVVAGDNPGYRTVMEPQPKLLIDPKDHELLAKRLAELLDNKKLTDKLHAWQSEYVKQFDVNVAGARVEAVYNQAIAKRNLNRHN